MILNLVRRNLRLYFRDKTSVFFSMLGVFIIILLYMAFLGEMMVLYTAGQFSGNPEIDVRFLMDSWIMAGVISAATVTTTLGAYGTMVNDSQSKVINDFKVSPLKRSTLVISYILSALVVGSLMSLVSFTFAEIYILISGGELISFLGLVQLLGIILLSVFMSSSVIFLIVIFVKSSNAFGTISTVFGSTIGFLMGVYIPIGNLPESVGAVIKYIPFSHPAVLMRQVMMNEAVDVNMMPEQFAIFTGLKFEYGDTIFSITGHVLVMIATAIVFLILGIVFMSRKKKLA